MGWRTEKSEKKNILFWQSIGQIVYDMNCGSVSGFRAVPLEQEVLLLSKKVWFNGSTMYFTYKFAKIHTYTQQQKSLYMTLSLDIWVYNWWTLCIWNYTYF